MTTREENIKKMSEEILSEEQLDEVSGGTNTTKIKIF